MKKPDRKLINVILILVVVLGVAIILYPFVSDWLQTRQHQKLINVYKADVSQLPEDLVEQEWQKAVEYNESLLGKLVRDPFLQGSGMVLAGNYMEVLNVNGIMGYLDIPCINVHLPVYHGTSEKVLKKGVGHIESTALPIGGEDINPILSAHTGLPSAKLFSDLVHMKEGDMFSLRVMDRTMYYKVDSIQVILPEETRDLTAVSGKDHVTLLTCTPYGINSHRLVVRGERCYEISSSFVMDREARTMWGIILATSCAVFLVTLIILTVMIIRNLRKSRKPVTLSRGVKMD